MIKGLIVLVVLFVPGAIAAVPGNYGPQPTLTCDNLWDERLPTGIFQLRSRGIVATKANDFLISLEEQGGGTFDDNRYFLVWRSDCSLRVGISNVDGTETGDTERTRALAAQATAIDNVMAVMWNEASGGGLGALDVVKTGLFSSLTGEPAPGTQVRELTATTTGASTHTWSHVDAYLREDGTPVGIAVSSTHGKIIAFSYDEDADAAQEYWGGGATGPRSVFIREDLNQAFVRRSSFDQASVFNLTDGTIDYSASGFQFQNTPVLYVEPSQTNASRMWTYDDSGDGFGVNWVDIVNETSGTQSNVDSWNGSQIKSEAWAPDGDDNFLACGDGSSVLGVGGNPFYWFGKFLPANNSFEWVNYIENPGAGTTHFIGITCTLETNGDFFVGYIKDDKNFTIEHYTDGNFTAKSYRDTLVLSSEVTTTTSSNIFDEDSPLWGGNKTKLAEASQVTLAGLDMMYAILGVVVGMALGMGMAGRFGAMGGAMVALVTTASIGWIPAWLGFLMFTVIVAALLFIKGSGGD